MAIWAIDLLYGNLGNLSVVYQILAIYLLYGDLGNLPLVWQLWQSTCWMAIWVIYLLDGEGKLLFKDSNHLLLQTLSLSTPTHILRVQRRHISKQCFQPRNLLSSHLAFSTPHYFPCASSLVLRIVSLHPQDSYGKSSTVFEFDQFPSLICFTIEKYLPGSAKDLNWRVSKFFDSETEGRFGLCRCM